MITGGLVVTHGQLGEILIKECSRIIVDCDRFESLSTHKLSAVEITSLVSECIGNEPWIVFVDSPGTAPAIRSHAALQEGQAVVTGVNFPMLLSFLVNREAYDFESLVQKMVGDGKRSLGVLWPLTKKE